MSGNSQAVFISYASEDEAAAGRIGDALRAAGIEVWFDRSELRGGDAWDHQIHERIHDCRLFVAIISAHTEARDEGYFRREWKLAVDRTHDMAEHKAFVVPVAVDDTSERDAAVPDKFRHVQWTRLPGGEATPAFVARIAALLDPRPETGANARSANPAVPSAISPRSGKRADIAKRRGPAVIWVAALVVALSCFAGYALWSTIRAREERQVAVVKPAASSDAPAVPEKSVAVLPFVDMSEKKDQEYFSDGLSEELIDRLAHAADLKVIARTSSFQFKGKNEDVRTIGHKLGVANLLEGSVRTSGNAIRVTAQLISVVDGTHRWSETYDRKRGDVFKVQDEIAGAVVNALKGTMAALPSSSRAHSTNVDSYNEVLRGHYLDNRRTRQDSDGAVTAYRQAIAIDPENAEAWLGIARNYNLRAQSGWMPPLDAYAEARKAVDRALVINPSLAAAHYELGALEGNYHRDFATEEREIRRSLQLEPSRAAGSLYEGIDAYQAGKPETAVLVFRRAKEVNPLDTFTLSWLSSALYASGNLLEAERINRQILEISPGYAGVYCSLGEILLAQNQPDAALAMMNKETDEGSRMICTPEALWVLGRHKEADAMLAQAQSKFANSLAISLAICYARRNDKDAAFIWLNRSYENHEATISVIKGIPELRVLRSDPRFTALLHRMNLPE